MNLTQYLGSQENQDMTDYFILHKNLREDKRECLCVSWNGEDGVSIYL